MKNELSPLREMTSHNNLHSLLFQATSAEYIALCVQTYQLARHAVLERLKEGTYRNPAVIFDLDETVLDNSAYQRWLVAAGMNFDEATSWREWCNAAEAGSVPGAVEFVEFIVARDVTPLFITSRENVTRSGTAENLHSLGLIDNEELQLEKSYSEESAPEAYALKTRLFMKKMGHVKIPRPDGDKDFALNNKFDHRVFCERVRKFEILLSIGDSLGDYAEYYGRVFDKNNQPVDGHPTIAGRRSAVWQDIRLFGREFIVVPNATYGSWVRALEANNLGAGDELAITANPVRGPLTEPQSPFEYGGEKPGTPEGTKLSAIPGKWEPQSEVGGT